MAGTVVGFPTNGGVARVEVLGTVPELQRYSRYPSLRAPPIAPSLQDPKYIRLASNYHLHGLIAPYYLTPFLCRCCLPRPKAIAASGHRTEQLPRQEQKLRETS